MKNLENTITILILAFVLAFGIITELRAETTCTWQGTKLIVGGSGKFSGCESIYDDDDNEIDWYEQQAEMTEIEFGDGVTTIGEYAFDNVVNLTTLNTNKVVTIEDEAFGHLDNLTSIELPNVTSIGAWAFEEAYELISLDMPKVLYIGGSAFVTAYNLEDIKMPNVERIDENAFNDTYLTSLEIPDSLMIVERDGLHTSGDIELIIPDSLNTENWHFDAFNDLYDCSRGGCNITFKCKGNLEKCQKNMAKFIYGDMCSDSDLCIDADRIEFDVVSNASECNGGMYEWDSITSSCKRMGEKDCNETDNYYYNGNTCTRRPTNGNVVCTNSSYKINDGYCDRIRYTPAEAAAVLNDNNNSVTITFKK